MWFKNFLINVILGFADVVGTLSGDGVTIGDDIFNSVIYKILGLILVPCFLCGLVYLIKCIANFIYTIQSKKNKRK